MKKKLILMSGLLISLSIIASENCPGNVTVVLDYPSKCDGNFAFQLDSTGSTWLCALSEKSNSMVLTAYAAGKKINPRLELTTGGDCKSIAHYQKPLYMSIHD